MELYKTINFQKEFKYKIDDQEPNVLFNGSIELYKVYHTNDKNKVTIAMWVLFDGTSISSVRGANGKRSYNKNDDQGYFTESFLLNAKIRCGKDKKYLPLQKNSPATTDSRKSFSSSISLNGGFFGTIATPGMTISHSSTVSVEDFLVSNGSDPQTLEHKYYLAAYDGGLYSDPSSMVDHPNLILSLAANDDQGPLGVIARSLNITPIVKPLKIVGDPTDSSIHNYPIISQGVFSTSYVEGQPVNLEINFTAVWQRVFIDWHEVLNNPTIPTSENKTFLQEDSFTVSFKL